MLARGPYKRLGLVQLIYQDMERGSLEIGLMKDYGFLPYSGRVHNQPAVVLLRTVSEVFGYLNQVLNVNTAVTVNVDSLVPFGLIN